MKISIDSVREAIKNRHAELAATRKEVSGLLILDNKLQLSIDPSLKNEGVAIAQRLNSLKRRNYEDEAYLKQIRSSCRLHEIDDEDGDGVNFDQLCTNLRKQLAAQLSELKRRFLNGEICSGDFETAAQHFKTSSDARIDEIRAVEAELIEFRKKQGGDDIEKTN